MASSSVNVPAAEPELFEAAKAVDQKAQLLADRIRSCMHFIAFTGAGVSTSAGIPDFRGPEGAWTLRDQGRQRTTKPVDTLQAIPTPTHMALVELQNKGLLKYLVSQNCDGLHRKSGILPDRISELHGNNNREYCQSCGKEYIRDFRAVATYERTVHDHRTGRKCALCGGVLLDSIINFGESLPALPVTRALHHAAQADLCLVLGSSLTVYPANEVPAIVGNAGDATLAICNLQKTDMDDLADLRIHSRTDDLMIRVMDKLSLPIPPFILHRRLVVETAKKEGGKHQLTIHGVDVDNTPATFLRSVKMVDIRRVATSEPFTFHTGGKLEPGTMMKLELEFMGHYGEPNLVIDQEYGGEDERSLYLLDYNPESGEWKTSRQDMS